MGADRLHHLAPRRAGVGPVGKLAQRIGPQVAGQHDQRLLEVHRAPLPVGQPTVVQNLQQHVEHIRMGLFDLVKQDHLIGPPTYRLGQHPALIIADIARGGTDQPRHRMLLHELAHVDAHHRRIVVEQIFGDGLGQLGLAHTGRPQKQEAAQGAVLVVQPRPRPPHRIGDSRQRLALADDPLAQFLFHAQQLFALALQHAAGGNAGPAFHNLGDLFGPDGFGHQKIALFRLGLGQPLFKAGDDAIGQLSRPPEVALALGLVKLCPCAVKLFLDVAGRFQLVALILPLRRHLGRFLRQVGQLAGQLFQPVLRCRILFLLQRLGLDLALQDLPVQGVKLFGLGIHLHPQPRRGFVHQVDCLVGQEAVGDVAVRQGCRRHQRRIRNPHAVVQLVLFLNAAQDRNGVFDGGFFHHHRLEPPRKRRVLFDIFAVLIQRCRADAVQLAPRQRGFDQVGCIHCAFGFPGTDQGVHLVDEKDDLARGGGHFRQHRFQPFFEFTTVLRPCNQRAHVQRHQLLVAQAFGHIAIDDAQRKSFGNRRLADAGFTDQHRVVLGAPGQDLHRAPDLFVAPDDRVDLALLGRLGQVARVFLQRIIALFSTGAVGGATLADIVDRGVQLGRRHGTRILRILGLAGHHAQRHQNPLDGNKAVARLGRDLFGLVQHAGKGRVHEGLGIARHLGQFAQGQINRFDHARRLSARLADQVAGQPLIIIHQGFQQMLGCKTLMAFAHRDRLRSLQEAARPFRELFQVHRHSPFSAPDFGTPLKARPTRPRLGCGKRDGRLQGSAALAFAFLRS